MSSFPNLTHNMVSVALVGGDGFFSWINLIPWHVCSRGRLSDRFSVADTKRGGGGRSLCVGSCVRDIGGTLASTFVAQRGQ